jgi:hypothetical protein
MAWCLVKHREKFTPFTFYLTYINRVKFRAGAILVSYIISNRGVKLTTHLLLVSRPRMRGVILPIPQYTFMTWCSFKAQGQLYLYIYIINNDDLNKRYVFSKEQFKFHIKTNLHLEYLAKKLV